eukprot:161722-Hanusia_phi.AAC.3
MSYAVRCRHPCVSGAEVLPTQNFEEDLVLDALVVLKDSPLFRGISEDAMSELMGRRQASDAAMISCSDTQGSF